jgi:light-independent protochlorophyllide reductase subunit B
MVLGSQMERHIAKRLGVPCAVISAPVHVQDFPARYSPQMGFEGANVLWDSWVHPLMMGLEEHLIGMFREDFEFHADASPSHLGHGGSTAASAAASERGSADVEPDLVAGPSGAGAVAAVLEAPAPVIEAETARGPVWSGEAEAELKKIPFFVRGKARRNTERFAAERAIVHITLEVLYDAKAHFGR